MFKPEFAFNNYLVRLPFKKRMPDTLNNCFILKFVRCAEPVSLFFNGRRDYSNSAYYAGTNKNVYYFESLGLGYEQIKFTLLGVAGIYKLINKEDPSRFEIVSTVNLSRRLNEYINLTKGIRSPK